MTCFRKNNRRTTSLQPASSRTAASALPSYFTTTVSWLKKTRLQSYGEYTSYGGTPCRGYSHWEVKYTWFQLPTTPSTSSSSSPPPQNHPPQKKNMTRTLSLPPFPLPSLPPTYSLHPPSAKHTPQTLSPSISQVSRYSYCISPHKSRELFQGIST